MNCPICEKTHNPFKEHEVEEFADLSLYQIGLATQAAELTDLQRTPSTWTLAPKGGKAKVYQGNVREVVEQLCKDAKEGLLDPVVKAEEGAEVEAEAGAEVEVEVEEEQQEEEDEQ